MDNDLSQLTLQQLNDLEISKQKLLENKTFIEFAENYNITLKKLKKPEKTLDELFNICHEKWLKSDLTTDLLFGMYFEDLQVSERIINLFLKSKNIKIGPIKKIIRQKTIELDFDIRGVRFDVLIEGSDKIVNIEIQTGKKTNLATRIRFYQAILDIHLLPKGGKETYKLLPETFIIFICSDQDPLGKGELEYSINPYAYLPKTQEYQIFDTKANWIIYNASGYKDFDETHENYDEDLKTFFAFLKNDHIANDFNDYLVEHFIKVKENREMEHDFMLTLVRDMEKYDEAIEEGVEIGVEIGVEKRNRQIIIKMLKDFNDFQINMVTDTPIEEIAKIREEQSKI